MSLISECADITVWPFTRADAEPTRWHEMTEKNWWYCLEVLPPISFPGGFAVSEANSTDAQGRETYWCCVQVGARYFGRYLALADAPAEGRRLREELGR